MAEIGHDSRTWAIPWQIRPLTWIQSRASIVIVVSVTSCGGCGGGAHSPQSRIRGRLIVCIVDKAMMPIML